MPGIDTIYTAFADPTVSEIPYDQRGYQIGCQLADRLRQKPGDLDGLVITDDVLARYSIEVRLREVLPLPPRILDDSDPFGGDLSMVIDTLDALALFRDDRALAQIAATARRRRWLAWGKTTQLREVSLRTLSRIGTPKARQMLADLGKTGDFFLRRLAAAAATRSPA